MAQALPTSFQMIFYHHTEMGGDSSNFVGFRLSAQYYCYWDECCIGPFFLFQSIIESIAVIPIFLFCGNILAVLK